jgi:hypothetical protein
LWVREAAEFEPEGDHIICRWDGAEWIMSVAVAQNVAAKLSRALDIAHERRNGSVVRFPARDH